MSRYLESVIKHRYPVSVILLVVFIIFLPVGYNSFDYISPEFGLEDLGTDQGVFTFSSLTDDIILLIDGDENIISDEFQNWTSSFVFDMQNRPIFQQYAQDGTPIEHIFSIASNLLGPYYVNLHGVIGFVNVTGFIILEGTQLLYTAWQDQIQSSSNTNVTIAYESMIDPFFQTLSSLAYGQLYQNIGTFWFDRLLSELEGETPTTLPYRDLVTRYSQNPSDWVLSSLQDLLKEGLEFLLSSFSSETNWNGTSLLPIAAEYLFGISDPVHITFLDTVFDNGSAATRAIQLARDARLPFLRNEIDIPGIPERIREYFLTALTNSDGYSVPTSIMIRFKLRSDLTETELSQVFEEIKILVSEYRAGLPTGYEIAFLSFLNYQLERSEAIAQEMHRVDLFAVIIGFVVLLVLIRNPIYSALIIFLAWSTTQITRGVIVRLAPLIGTFNGTSFSITTTFLLGAAMNYVVFFVFRYMQERSKGTDHPVVKSTKTAVHSVIISGLAITLALIPYLWSDIQVLHELSQSLIAGMIIQTILLSHILPAVFGIIDQFQKIQIDNHTPRGLLFSFRISRDRVSKIILSSIVLLVISGIVIGQMGTSFATTDFVAESGETGLSFDILESKYPENYLSRYLITINTSTPVLENGIFNEPLLAAVDALSMVLASQSLIDYVVSVAWPIDGSFNYSKVVSIIDKEAAYTVAEGLVDGELTFIIVQSMIPSQSLELRPQAESIIKLVSDFVASSDPIISAQVSGLPVEIAGRTETALSQLPGQVALAMLFLIVFLAFVLKSLFIPIRLLISIILANIYSIAITSVLYRIIVSEPLNIIMITSSFLVLLGLGTDFDVYIIRRIEEEKTLTPSYWEAVERGLSKSAPAILASGLVMSFSFLALLSADITLVRQFALITFITILIDIFFVRTLLVPAILLFASKSSDDHEN